MYRAVDAPVDAILPMLALPPGVLSTPQVTSLDAPLAPVTVAVNTCAPPVGTVGVAGETSTTMFGGGGCEELDPTVPAQADSKIAQTHRIISQTIGTQPRASRMRRAVFSRSLAPCTPTTEARDVPERRGQEEIDSAKSLSWALFG